MSGRVGCVTLPGAIPFTAALYTLGIPPEFLGGVIFEEMKEDEWKLIEKYYVNLKHDLAVAGGHLSWRNIELLRDNYKLMAKSIGICGEKLRGVLNEVLNGLETMEKAFGIKL